MSLPISAADMRAAAAAITPHKPAGADGSIKISIVMRAGVSIRAIDIGMTMIAPCPIFTMHLVPGMGLGVTRGARRPRFEQLAAEAVPALAGVNKPANCGHASKSHSRNPPPKYWLN
jgi:hypothetical protein